MRLYVQPCLRIPQGYVDVDDTNLVYNGEQYVNQSFADKVAVASQRQTIIYKITHRDSTNSTQTLGVLFVSDPLNGVITYPINTLGTQFLNVTVTIDKG